MASCYVAVVVAEEIDVLSDCRLLLEQGVVCVPDLVIIILYYYSQLLYSAILCSRADSLRTCRM